MRFQDEIGRPGDRRGFIHKKLLGGVETLARSGVLGSAAKGFATGGVGGLARELSTFAQGGPLASARTLTGATVSRTLTARPTQFSAAEKELGKIIKFGEGLVKTLTGGNGNGNGECPSGTVWDPRGYCTSPRSRFGGGAGRFGFGVGEAVVGRYGAGLEPGSMTIDRAVCLRGMQLGNDGVCYNKSQISNKQRMWPAGRKPLLTGGDMRAISTAARAGRRLEGATKRLQRMGMMKKPVRRAGPTRHAALLEAHVGTKH